MKRPIHSLIRPAVARVFAFLLLAAVAIASTGCRKQNSSPPTAAQAQPGVIETNQPLVGEVQPFMTTQLRLFAQQQGRLPTNFNELRASLDLIPRIPPGKTWAIDYTTLEVKIVPR